MDYIPRVQTEKYTYDLPTEYIAQHPLSERDHCRLLVADCPTRSISHHIFAELPSLLPPGSVLVRNITKVVHSRLILQKSTGGLVEVFLLRPLTGSLEAGLAAFPPAEWECLIRGRRLRVGTEISATTAHLCLHARILELASGQGQVQLYWEPKTYTLAEILHHLGHVPLPPYLHRPDEPEDREHYQTVYASIPGSVAAPTAGLHFTERLLQELQQLGIAIVDVCLHVGLDTFKPLQASDIRHHYMHSEYLSVSRDAVAALHSFFLNPEREWLCAVGTTSVRTVESLYWHGVRLLYREAAVWEAPFLSLPQWEAYRLLQNPTPLPAEALAAILSWLDHHGLSRVEGATELFIVPGYRYQVCDAIITNFHQPRSTLLLLVAAFIGDFWCHVYTEALTRGYRFLSYGDASLLICPRHV
ncbi:MAG: S-adenosylmethionine:tRNA ribosyltransferase-isomerase [Candidatus Kapabacteria bacterium]|nr:S-adenosylmethionine:tRNA ribosyltransferase-isomerase [Candidatus Kapabacteria bacterium]MDW8224581.1 S-adenosylmethionine:tRNA ribosyltransferase-isomerase [Bacteroidota bacterium]